MAYPQDTPCPQSNPCAQCNEPIVPCVTACPAPVYTSEGCPNGTTDGRCVIIDNDTENCIGIIKGQTTLKSFITKLLIYLKLKKQLSNTDKSITITPILDSCNDKADIKVNVSSNVNNQLQILSNGLFVTPSNISVVPALNSCIIVTPTTIGNLTTYTLSFDITCLAALLCPLCTTSTSTCLPPTNLTVIA
jgi:hypothetical protein